jgi:hypothetical protein
MKHNGKQKQEQEQKQRHRHKQKETQRQHESKENCHLMVISRILHLTESRRPIMSLLQINSHRDNHPETCHQQIHHPDNKHRETCHREIKTLQAKTIYHNYHHPETVEVATRTMTWKTMVF